MKTYFNFFIRFLLSSTNLLFILIFFISSYSSLTVDAGVLSFSNNKKHYSGVLIKNGDNYYAYTTQSALLNLNHFIIKSSNGNILKKTGKVEVAYYNDIARVEVNPTKSQLVDLYDTKSFATINDDVNINKSKNMKILGIGRSFIYLKEKLNNEMMGLPVFSKNGEVIGLVSKGDTAFDVSYNNRMKFEKITIVDNENHLAARLNINNRWKVASKVGFFNACKVFSNIESFQEKCLSLLNWWIVNPYQPVPSDIEYPSEFKSWVKTQNTKSKPYKRLLTKVLSSPKDHSSILKSIIDNTYNRGVRFSKVIKAQSRKSRSNCKSQYLRDRASIYIKKFNILNELIKAKLKSLKTQCPYLI